MPVQPLSAECQVYGNGLAGGLGPAGHMDGRYRFEVCDRLAGWPPPTSSPPLPPTCAPAGPVSSPSPATRPTSNGSWPRSSAGSNKPSPTSGSTSKSSPPPAARSAPSPPPPPASWPGTADLAVGPPGQQQRRLLVDQARIVALISPAHKWAREGRHPRPPARRRTAPAVRGARQLLRSPSNAPASGAVEPAIKFQSRSSPALAALAAHGVGVALLPDHAVPASFTGLVRPLHGADDLLRRESWLSWRTGTLTTPALHNFVEQARRQAATTLDTDTAHKPAQPGHDHRP